MRKTKEVLRLKFRAGPGTAPDGAQLLPWPWRRTVHDYLQRAKAAGIGWPLPEGSVPVSEREIDSEEFAGRGGGCG